MERPMEEANGDVIAVVLAAGRARRFGSDKRLIHLEGGCTLLNRTLSVVIPNFSTTYVVLKETDDPQVLLFPAYLRQVKIIRAPHADGGLGSSIADAFCILKTDHGMAAAIFLGDMPWLLPATCRKLITCAAAEKIIRPHYTGQLGHPVIFGRDFWAELQQVKGENGARELFQRYAKSCLWVEVDDPGVTLDIDYPVDIKNNEYLVSNR
ncbi:nucleotidyltransferase family protein [Oceanisphaera sediminis]|uniref:Nucleotidyltransferase family protein n=1 Tax=Oceanisphaera sediminis TaxID=981381 RepID=A0ABP7DTD4_9GAMM